jgi:predicted phosphodiesterase
MRIAVVSDIHGNLPALEAVVADAGERGCTAFVNLGDIVSGPLWPRETADYLMPRPWTTISGNHERQLLTLPPERMNLSDRHAAARIDEHHRDWLRSLPTTLELSDSIFLCHGTPVSDVTYFLHEVEPDEVREATVEEVSARTAGRAEPLILCGHTHLPRIVALADGRTIANPGSVGLQAYDDDHPVPHVMEAGSPHARYAVVENGAVTLLTVDYDHEAAARKADAEGRPDWAQGLRFGWMGR